jgi:hypothetical protein
MGSSRVGQASRRSPAKPGRHGFLAQRARYTAFPQGLPGNSPTPVCGPLYSAPYSLQGSDHLL